MGNRANKVNKVNKVPTNGVPLPPLPPLPPLHPIPKYQLCDIEYCENLVTKNKKICKVHRKCEEKGHVYRCKLCDTVVDDNCVHNPFPAYCSECDDYVCTVCWSPYSKNCWHSKRN